jgi:ATP phosphoribosyltransferase regulatory subunit
LTLFTVRAKKGRFRAKALVKSADDRLVDHNSCLDCQGMSGWSSPSLRAAALLAVFEREGYRPVEPAILQPADIFLDVSGEDLRRRMFTTQDAEGRDMCLRPDFTIPVCRDHLSQHRDGDIGAYAYLGPVFRMRSGESGEFLQAGIELLGRSDTEAADAEVLALTVEAVALAGLAAPQTRLGDVAVIKAVVKALKVPPTAARRLMRAISAGKGAKAVTAIATIAGTQGIAQPGLIAALQGQDPGAAKSFVEDILAIAGISSVGGRSAGDIAARFLAKASEQQSVPDEAQAILGRVLAVEGDPDDAAIQLRRIADQAQLDLAAELDAFEARTGFMAARGLDVAAMRFSAGFARHLDYYSSFIFELHDPAPGSPKPVAGGGRYDSLLSRLGANAPVPAVGASIWLDRLNGRPA